MEERIQILEDALKLSTARFRLLASGMAELSKQPGYEKLEDLVKMAKVWAEHMQDVVLTGTYSYNADEKSKLPSNYVQPEVASEGDTQGGV